MSRHITIIFLISISCSFSLIAEARERKYKSGYERDEGFAGPGSTVRQLEEDDEKKETVFRFPSIDAAFQPWFDTKKQFKDDYGIKLGLAYTTLYQKLDDSLTENDDASSGILRLSAKWRLFKNDDGSKGFVVMSVDNRSAYSTLAPNELAGEAGYIGQSGALFGDQDTLLGDVYYSHYFTKNTSMIIGRYDPNDFLDVLGYANPWTSFQNLSILFNTSIGLADWSTGIGIGHWFNDQWYASASANDANGVATDSDFEFDTDELYKTAEIGWSPSRSARYLSNIHVTYWEVDKRERDGVDDAYGYTVGANWTWDETWMLFSKLGFSDADAANDPQIHEESYTLGGIYYLPHRSDLMGLAVNYGKLAAPGLDDQTTTELFYRVQLSENVALTPSLQWLKNPALNNDDDSNIIMGLRLRFSL